MIRIKPDSPLWRALPIAWLGPVHALVRRLGVETPLSGSAQGQAWGIDALPEGIGSLPIGAPVAFLWQDRTFDWSWIHALLADALACGPVFLLAEDEVWVDRLLAHAPLLDAHAKGGALTCYVMRPSMVGGGGRSGLQPVLAELKEAGLSAIHTLFVVGSPKAHFGSTVSNIRQWGTCLHNWCQKRIRPVVFCFHQYSDPQVVLSPLRSLMDVFGHVATMSSDAMKPILFVDRWNAATGPIFEARFGLKSNPATERLVYDGSQTRGQLQLLVEAPDQYDVITTQGALMEQKGLPAAWVIVPLASDLPAATQRSVAATVLIDSGPSAGLDAVFRLVHQLRIGHPRTLKIVVRETHEKLRSNFEQVLLYLGANTVVSRDVGFARMVRTIEDISTETFTLDTNPDFDAALSGFMPDPVSGYLPAPEFCKTVLAMLNRTGHMGLKHSFLRLEMQTRIPHLDAIRACTAKRNGDVITADQNALYVFMFACSEIDVEPSLNRLFSIPPLSLFSSQTSDSAIEGMRTMLRKLEDVARKGLPDYTAHLAPRAPPVPVARAATAASGPVAASTQSNPQNPSAIQIIPAGALPTTQAKNAESEPAKTRPTVHARPISRNKSVAGASHGV